MTTRESKTREAIENRIDQVTRDAREAGRKAWLVGLGAVGSVDERARGLFAEWKTRGEELDGKAGDLGVFEPWNEANARAKAFGQKAEARFEEGMTRTLHRLGIPARDDIQQLSERVEQLSRKVESLRVEA